MSEEGNRDDATVTLQYLTLRTNLLSCLNELSLEFAEIASSINKPHIWEKDALERTLNLIADKKTYLLDIAKQGLTSDDYAHFKDLADNFKVAYWSKKGFFPKVTREF